MVVPQFCMVVREGTRFEWGAQAHTLFNARDLIHAWRTRAQAPCRYLISETHGATRYHSSRRCWCESLDPTVVVDMAVVLTHFHSKHGEALGDDGQGYCSTVTVDPTFAIASIHVCLCCRRNTTCNSGASSCDARITQSPNLCSYFSIVRMQHQILTRVLVLSAPAT